MQQQSVYDAIQANSDANALQQYGVLDKHRKYQTQYKTNDIYWGLGLEHEFYLETGQYTTIDTTSILTHNKPERYSVRYNTVYNAQLFTEAINNISQQLPKITIPVLYNAYSWQKTDICDRHITTYSKTPQPNPLFGGETIHNHCISRSPWLQSEYDKSYTFDGDTFEIMTQNFYKTTVKKCINEYAAVHATFIKEIAAALEQPLRIMSRNYPFAVYKTNPGQIAMFNNGTVHFNITLPTRMGPQGKIECWRRFVDQHREFARAIQWMEPLWLARYGAGDPLAASKYYGEYFSAASQRTAVSRYIGIGTYDTDTMPCGKILQCDVSTGTYPWYDAFYKCCSGYERLSKIGMDLNFNKHPNHGLEVRFFDQIGEKDIEAIYIVLMNLADFSLSRPRGSIPNIRTSAAWCELFVDVMQYGSSAPLSMNIIKEYERIFRFSCNDGCRTVGDLYSIICQHLSQTYNSGNCAKCMMPDKWVPQPVRREIMESNAVAVVGKKKNPCICM